MHTIAQRFCGRHHNLKCVIIKRSYVDQAMTYLTSINYLSAGRALSEVDIDIIEDDNVPTFFNPHDAFCVIGLDSSSENYVIKHYVPHVESGDFLLKMNNFSN